MFDGPKERAASMIIRRRLLQGSIAVVLGLIAVTPSEACTCVVAEGAGSAWPSLEELVAKAPAAVVGRVVAQGKRANGEGTAYLDVKVIESVKGPSKDKTIRVWDAMVGSSCSLGLDRLPLGSLVAFSLQRNAPKYREFHDVMGLAIEPGDYLLGSCGDYFRRMESEALAHAWATRVKQSGKVKK